MPRKDDIPDPDPRMARRRALNRRCDRLANVAADDRSLNRIERREAISRVERFRQEQLDALERSRPRRYDPLNA